MSMPTKDQVRDAFSVPTEQDRTDLKRFIRKVDGLHGSAFMEHQIGMRGELLPGASHLGGQAWNLGVEVPNEALLKSVIGDFRLLYTDTNRSSAMRVLKILERSAYERGTPTGRTAIEALKEIRKYLHERRKTDPVGQILDADQDGTLVARSPEDIVNVWFNGEYFHDDQEFAAKLEPGDDLGVGMLRLTLHTAIRDHVYAWIVIRKTTSELLDAYPEV
jgi:hypothetical protein